MQVLIDECLPKRLKRELREHTVAPNNRFPTLQPLMPKVRELLQTIQPREVIYVET